jgi:fimbrial chaperone protein
MNHALAIIAMFFAAIVAPGLAYAYRVEPMMYELAPSGQKATKRLKVENTHSVPIHVELEAFRVSIDTQGKRTFTPADADFIMFPPQASIPPMRTQAFQVRYVGDRNIAAGQIYVVRLSQVNVVPHQRTTAENGATTEIGLRLNFNTTVVVQPPGIETDLSVVGAMTSDPNGALIARIANSGPGVGDIAQVRIQVTREGRSETVPDSRMEYGETSLMAPGSERIIVLDKRFAGATALTVSPP